MFIDNSNTKRSRRVFLFEGAIVIAKEQAGGVLNYIPKYTVLVSRGQGSVCAVHCTVGFINTSLCEVTC